MTTVFANQLAMAQRLIAKYGQFVTWNSQSLGAPVDGSQPWKASDAPAVSKQIKIAFFPLNRKTIYTLGFLTGSTPNISDVHNVFEYGLMASVPFTPNQKDTVVRNGQQLRIDGIDVLRPDGTPLLYTVYFKA